MSSEHNVAVDVAKTLVSVLSNEACIFTDQLTTEFKELLIRWSDVDVQVPSAILQPSCEGDISEIVKHAAKHNIPFIAKGGGHSTWSTIGSGGWIIDLSLLRSISINTSAQTATIQAGVLTKPVNEAVANAGFMIHSANAANVGHIGFLLGGGSSVLMGMHGLAIDALITARVVTATGRIVTASSTKNGDLFWALKGAGQYFGIVTEVTVKIFPQTTDIISWACIFTPPQIKEVAKAVKELVDGGDQKSFGVAMITLPPGLPGQTKPVITVSITHFRSEAEAEGIMKPLLAANPVAQMKRHTAFSNLTDAADKIDKKGGFKSVVSCGLKGFDPRKFEKCLDSWTGLVDEHPEAASTFFMFLWASKEGMKSFGDESSAYGHRDIGCWSFLWPSALDEEFFKAAVQSSEDFIELCQAGQEESGKAVFPSHSRVKSVEQRYRGVERRLKLGKVKRTWDPEGRFTKQFL
ncbi:hypothetical protein BKA61DRAFT_547409 [Leptodontidium sp. MPI-SDFR-AT-0119]|nr:hypothetical protein BKA61DRAFT_547409 [Leptodontidium sp. MPI-SDFR-AT-0119]